MLHDRCFHHASCLGVHPSECQKKHTVKSHTSSDVHPCFGDSSFPAIDMTAPSSCRSPPPKSLSIATKTPHDVRLQSSLFVLNKSDAQTEDGHPMVKFDNFPAIPRTRATQCVDVTKLSTNARQHHDSRVRVIGIPKRSDRSNSQWCRGKLSVIRLAKGTQ